MTTADPIADRAADPAVPGPAVTARALRALTRAETRLFLRDPAAAFFSLLFPALLLGILGSVPGFRRHTAALHGQSTVEAYVPVLIVLTLATLAMNGLAPTLTVYRERGVLRRLAVSPVAPSWMPVALVTVYAGVAVVSLALVTAVGRIAFGIPLPRQPLGLLAAFVLSAAALMALGLLIAALAPSAKSGNAIGMAVFFPLMFCSGLWLPRPLMPALLRHIADVTPSGAATQALSDAWQGHWPAATGLGVLALSALVLGALAVRLPRRH